MIDRKVQPSILDAVELDLRLKPYQNFTLDNGVPVYAVNAGEQDVIMVEWVFYAGNWFEEKNVVAAATNYMLKNGTAAKTAFAINEHFEYYGAYLNRTCFNETASVTLHCLAKHLNKLLPVVAELLTESIFPAHELAIYKQIQIQKLAVNLKKCEFVANRIIDELLYGFHHPYGRYISQEEYDTVLTEELKNFIHSFTQMEIVFCLQRANCLPILNSN